MSKTILENMIELRRMVNANEHYSNYGICGNYGIFFDKEVPSRVKAIWKRWRYYSGDIGFPVPSPNKHKTVAHYYINNNKNKWINRYGALRRDLLDFTIKELQKEKRKRSKKR